VYQAVDFERLMFYEVVVCSGFIVYLGKPAGSLLIYIKIASSKVIFISPDVISAPIDFTFVRIDLTFIRTDLTFVRIDLTFIRTDLTFVRIDLTFIRIDLTFVRIDLTFIRTKVISFGSYLPNYLVFRL